MPQPQAPASPAAALLSTEDFARRVRTKLAGEHGRDPYASLSDQELTHRIVQKYPVYRDQVVDLGAGMEGIEPEPDPRVLQMQREALAPHDEHERMTAIQRGLESDINQVMEPPSPLYGPLGVLAAAASPTAKGIVNAPQRGVVQAGKGLAAAAGSQILGGFGATPRPGALSDILEGGMSAAAPTLPAAGIAAPAATVMGLLVGAAGQYGMRQAAPSLGLQGEDARLAENIAGLATGLVGAEAASAGVSAARARMLNASDAAAWSQGRQTPRRITPGDEGWLMSTSGDPARDYPQVSADHPEMQAAYPVSPYEYMVRAAEARQRTPTAGPIRPGAMPRSVPRSTGTTHVDLGRVATPPPQPEAIASTARAVSAVPAARPGLKQFAQTLDAIKAGEIDPGDPGRSAYERAAAAVYKRTGTLTIEDLQTLHGRFKTVGDTLGQVAQQADVAQPPPAPGSVESVLQQAGVAPAAPGWDPSRALPPVGTSVVGGVPQSVLDPVVQARLDQPPRFLAVAPGQTPLRYDTLRGQVVVGSTPPEFPPEIDAFGQMLEHSINGQAPPEPGAGRLVPDPPGTLRLRRELATPPPGVQPQPGLPIGKGKKGQRPKFGAATPPPAVFDEGAGPVGITPEGQAGLPIDPRFRMRLGDITRKYNRPLEARYRYTIDPKSGRRQRVYSTDERGPAQTHLDELNEAELTELGKMVVGMESSDYVPKIRNQWDGGGRGQQEEWIAGAGGHPVYYDIVGGNAEAGPSYNYSRAEVVAKLRQFLTTGKRSVVSDLAIDRLRNGDFGQGPREDGLPHGHAAAQVPEEYGRRAALLPEGPGFSPMEREQPPVAGEQGKLAQAPPEPDLPDWVTDQTVHADAAGGYEPEEGAPQDLGPTQGSQTIGGPPPSPRAAASRTGRAGTPGRVSPGLEPPDVKGMAQGPEGPEDRPLPGTEQVRETENPTPQFDAPFSLGSEVGQPPAGKQDNLFGEPPPAPKATKSRAPSALDNPRLFDEAKARNAARGTTFAMNTPPPIDAAATKTFRRWLNAKRADHYQEPWYEAAQDALAEDEPMKAWRIAAMASGEVPTVGQPPPKGAAAAGGLKATPEGSELPPRTSVGRGGLLVPPATVRNLDPKHTDLLLGHTILRDTLEQVDHLADGVVLTKGNTDPALRLNRQVVSAMLEEAQTGKGELRQLSKLLKRRPEEVARHLMRQASNAGRVLNAWSQFHSRNLDVMTFLEKAGIDTSGLDHASAMAMARSSPEVRAKIRAAEKVADTARALGILVDGNKARSAVDRIQFEHALAGDRNKVYMGLLNDIENFSRALIVSQPVTGIRNLWTQAGRYFVGAVDQAMSVPMAAITGDLKTAKAHAQMVGEMLHAPFRPGSGVSPKRAIGDTMQAVYDFTEATLRTLPTKDVRKTLGILDKFPQQAAEYMGTMTGDLTPGKPTTGARGAVSRGLAKLASPRVRNVITAFNRSAEYSQRSVVFDAIFRAGLKAKGIDPNRLLTEDFETIANRVGARELEELTAGAMHAALDYTFASKPLYNSIPGRLLKIMSDIPVVSPLLRTGYPFPRFNLVAAPRFIYDHSPAALLEILRLPIDMATGGNAPKGRLYTGLQAAKIQHEGLPKMEFAVRQAEARHGLALQDWIGARKEAAVAARRLKRMEQRAAKTGTLEGVTEQYQRVAGELRDQITARDEAKLRAAAAKHEWRALAKQRAQLEQQVRRAKSIGAPTFHEWAARQATGLALLGAAYAVRDSEGAKGTQWYEYRVGKRTLDFRAFAPFVQYLLIADWMHDVQHQTDWKAVHQATAGKHNPLDWSDAVRSNYSGKYTSQTFGKQLVQAFLSISQAAGTTLSVVDLMTGESSSQGLVNDIYNGLTGSLGQFLGRFTVPLQTINDVTGQFSEEERKARIPQEPVEGDRKTFDQILGPTVSHIPGLRRTIPEKVNPMSGQPIATTDPLARQFAGLSQRERSVYEQELARVGLPWFKATPRQVGDRDFDNAVARGYHEGLQRFLPKLLENPRYKKMPTDLARETLQGVMTDIKAYAYGQVAKRMGAKALHDKMERPGDRDRRSRWQGYLKTLRTELGQERPEGAQEQVGAPPPGR